MTGGRPVSQVGEFELIRSISNLIASSRVKSSGVLLEAGDDTAIWQP
ncbi:MAG TPA: thiamine-phosphate kinase, partial [Chloroflexi bacterium]|nr:thiamine-phosphate kinase [Chloroflexota bacterium]